MALHKLTIIGRLVGDVRVTPFANGGKVAKFGLPINFTRRKKNQETGEWEGESFIIDVDCFNREHGVQLADLVSQYLKKGSQVYVEGRLKPNEFVDRNGVKVFKPVLVADIVEFLDRPTDYSGSSEGGTRTSTTPSPSRGGAPVAPAASRPARAYEDEEPDMPAPSGHQEEDIPF